MAATKYCSCARAVKNQFKPFHLHTQQRKTNQYIDEATITERKQTNNAYRARSMKNRKMGWLMKKTCKQPDRQTESQSEAANKSEER